MARQDPAHRRIPTGATILGLAAGLLLGSGALTSCAGETCEDCIGEKCSALRDMCEENSDCGCVSDCIGRSGIPAIDDCLETCGLTERPSGYAELEDCVTYGCPDSDECSSRNMNPAGDPPAGCDYSMATGAPFSDGTLADCAFDGSLAFDPTGEVLQLESTDQSVCVRIERRNDGRKDGTTSWTLINMRVGTVGMVSLVEDSGDHCWYTSHHNFKDIAHAWTGTRHYDVIVAEPGHGGDRYYEIRPFEQGPLGADACGASSDQVTSECDTPISEPIGLVPVNP